MVIKCIRSSVIERFQCLRTPLKMMRFWEIEQRQNSQILFETKQSCTVDRNHEHSKTFARDNTRGSFSSFHSISFVRSFSLFHRYYAFHFLSAHINGYRMLSLCSYTDMMPVLPLSPKQHSSIILLTEHNNHLFSSSSLLVSILRCVRNEMQHVNFHWKDTAKNYVCTLFSYVFGLSLRTMYGQTGKQTNRVQQEGRRRRRRVRTDKQKVNLYKLGPCERTTPNT